MLPERGGKADNSKGDPIANYLAANAASIGLQYMIWDHWKWSQAKKQQGKYGGPNPHTDHLHVELNLGASEKTGMWWTDSSPPASATDTSSSSSSTAGQTTSTTSSNGPASPPAVQVDASCDLGSQAKFNCGNAYERGVNKGPRQCVRVMGKAVATNTYCPLMKMFAAMRAAGVRIQLNSAFRTNAEQSSLYSRNCRGGLCSPATARPGNSRHQNGIAFDISTRTQPATYTWLRNNAQRFGFVRTVSSETWHWEYRPGERCNRFVQYTCR
jgi:hypothetical protein